MKVYFSFLQLLCISCTFCGSESPCAVNSSDVQRGNSCNDSIPCDSLNFIDLLQDATSNGDQEATIHLCLSVYEIGAENVTFRDKINVSIFGAQGGSTLSCQNGTTGLQLTNITTVEIENVILDQCSFSNTIIEDHFQVNFSSSIYISGCTTVSITDVTVQNTVGVGLALIDNKYISITNSTFMNNRPGNTSAGGGVFIESSKIENGSFVIENCTFTNNSAKNDSIFENEFGKSNSDDVIDFVRGGGMNVYFRGKIKYVDLTIISCRFDKNEALHGGALQLYFTGSLHDIRVYVNHSHFRYNKAKIRGGAVGAGYIHESSEMNHNLIRFSHCNFSNNTANEQGGGMYLYAAPTEYTNHNAFEFHKCSWIHNEASYGAAIKINPYTTRKFVTDGHLPKPVFQDCTFKDNVVHHTTKCSKANYVIHNRGKGALLANIMHILFKGKMLLEGNTDTAVHMISSAMEIERESNIVFKHNQGHLGGAIGLQGSSAIHVNDNISITFLNNSASGKGGAIFQETLDNPGALTVRKCFIKYMGDYRKKVLERNIKLSFENNTVLLNKFNESKFDRQSIFLFSILPCKRTYEDVENHLKALNLIANFTFIDYRNDTDIATLGSMFKVYDIPRELIPGKEMFLNVTLLDDTYSSVPSPVFRVSVVETYQGSVFIDPAHTYVSNKKLKITGKPGNQAKIRIFLSNLQDIELLFNITLIECPPGYVFDDKNSECICSANSNTKYVGIQVCNLTAFKGILLAGQWAGYDDNNASDDHFQTSLCPMAFCTNLNLTNNTDITLPEYATINELSDKVCNKNRHGRVCAKCKNGTSVYYHTQNTFNCEGEEYCHLGILFYILSEIVPVTILFLFVIFFDIKLTNGSLNALLLYAQIFESLEVYGNNLIDFDEKTNTFLELLNFFISFFNLKFFAHPKLSFCLFKGATSLSIIAFGYVTVTYSLLLVLLTVSLINSPFNKLNKYIQKVKGRKTYISESIIHGLSSFLVLCYARSTKISLQILTPQILFAKGRKKNGIIVFYYGVFNYLKDGHLLYAIPAIFALIFMSLLPPLLLLSYPLCYKVLALLGIQESKFTNIVCKIIPLQKFKPFFDSFQSTFKDNHRYFASLYFIYKLLAMLLFVISSSLSEFYLLLQLQFILTMAVHSWIQPYKEKWHNRLEIFIFIILAILNGITLSNVQLRLNPMDFHRPIQILSRIQVILAYTPLLLIVGYTLGKLVKKLSTRCCLNTRSQNTRREDELEISLSMFERNHQNVVDTGYKNVNELLRFRHN